MLNKNTLLTNYSTMATLILLRLWEPNTIQINNIINAQIHKRDKVTISEENNIINVQIHNRDKVTISEENNIINVQIHNRDKVTISEENNIINVQIHNRHNPTPHTNLVFFFFVSESWEVIGS